MGRSKTFRNVFAVVLLLALAVFVGSMIPRIDSDPVRPDSIRVAIHDGVLDVHYTTTETGYVAFRFAAYDLDGSTRSVRIERYFVSGFLGYPGYGEPSQCAAIPLAVLEGKEYDIEMRSNSGRFVVIAHIKGGQVV